MINIEKQLNDLLKKANFQSSLKKVTTVCYETVIKNVIYKKKEKESLNRHNELIALLKKQNELLEKLIDAKSLADEQKDA